MAKRLALVTGASSGIGFELAKLFARHPALNQLSCAGTALSHAQRRGQSEPSVGLVIGVDAHKKTHTLVAVDGHGRKLAEKTVEATDAGHTTALHWALVKFGDDDLTWGIENSSSDGLAGK